MEYEHVTKTEKERTRKVGWRWLIFLLLPLALYMPFLASDMQMSIVGSEHVCCMPDNLQELLAKAAVARSRRSESNAIMNGCMLGGVAILAAFTVLYFTLIWRKQSRKMQNVSGIVVGIIVLLVLAWLLYLMAWYGANTEEFYQYAQQWQWPFV